MSFLAKPTLEQAGKFLRKGEKDALGQKSTLIGGGFYKDVYKGPNSVLKQFTGNIDTEYLEDRETLLNNTDSTPWSEITDLGTEEYPIIRQQPSDYTHNQAVNRLGLETVVHKDIAMLISLREENINYLDFKPGNIGYFCEEKDSYEAMPIDIFDPDALEEGQPTQTQAKNTITEYIHGSIMSEGIIDLYDIEANYAKQLVSEALANETEIEEQENLRTTIEEAYSDCKNSENPGREPLRL